MTEPRTRLAAGSAVRHQVSRSPFGPDDEIGMLNLSNAESRQRAWERADVSRYYDISVEYHVGMPSWAGLGDPTYQQWMTHTPSGTVTEDPLGLGEEQNRLVAYSGDCISMYTHTGTHIDALNHFGYSGQIWNGFTEAESLGSRHWFRNGPESHPPLIARTVLVDVAGHHDTAMLPDSYGIGVSEIQEVLAAQGSVIEVGDVVLIRTGRMNVWDDGPKYLFNEPGIDREAAAFLAESGAMIIGCDSVALEVMPSTDPENWHPVHTYLLAEAGVPIMENAYLEEIATARLFEAIMIGAGLRLRGATASPMRPILYPCRDSEGGR